jgi:hypothetical protein
VNFQLLDIIIETYSISNGKVTLNTILNSQFQMNLLPTFTILILKFIYLFIQITINSREEMKFSK